MEVQRGEAELTCADIALNWPSMRVNHLRAATPGLSRLVSRCGVCFVCDLSVSDCVALVNHQHVPSHGYNAVPFETVPQGWFVHSV